MTEKKRQKLKRQLQESRFRLLQIMPSFASPLREMYYVASSEVWRVSTNGEIIYLDPDWFGKLTPAAADFILAHQLMHIGLNHIHRPKFYVGDRFHLAADIVANAGIQRLGWDYDKLPGIGNIYAATFYPKYSGAALTAEEALRYVPFDPSTMKEGTRRTYMIDSEYGWGRRDDPYHCGEVILDPKEKDPEDLVFVSTKGSSDRSMQDFFLSHQTISGDEEEEEKQQTEEKAETISSDSWEHMAMDDLQTIREQKRDDARQAPDIHEIRKWQRIMDTKIHWRELLNFFVQEELGDYTFMPPDRRLQETGLFLPDFNDAQEKAKDVLFMVDTSGSIDDDLLSMAYGEIREAVNQFGGRLRGMVGFFDVRVYAPVGFEHVYDIDALVPKGGGGTNYDCIFDYVRENMADDLPSSIVIFTDGDATFPPEEAAMGVHTLWLFTDEKAVAPWGRYARIKGESLEF